MNKISLVVFIIFLTGGFYIPIARAQENTNGRSEVITDTNAGNNNTDTQPVTIDWPEIETGIDPLEEIQLQEPQLSNGSRGERQTYLQTGQIAPWEGVLLNTPAIAFILAETQASYSRAQLALVRQREADTNRLNFEVGRLRLQLTSDREQANIIIAGQNRTISRLELIHKNYVAELTGGFWRTRFGSILKYGLIVVGSVAVGVIVGYIAAP